MALTQQKVDYSTLISKMISTIQQDTLLQQRIRTEVEDLRDIVKDFKNFYNFEDDTETRIPYPYRLENQPKYNTHETKISSAFEMIEDVINYTKKMLFEVERDQAPDNFNMQMQQSEQPEMVMAGSPQPGLIQRGMQRITGVKKKKIINKSDPYQSNIIPFFNRAYQLLNSWDLHKEWHEEGTDFSEDELKRFGYNAFLTNHRAIFSRNVETDLLRIYWQGLSLQRLREKQIFGNVLTKSLSEMRQMEQNPQRPS